MQVLTDFTDSENLHALNFNRYPVPFKCIIKPRSAAAEALIRDSANEEG